MKINLKEDFLSNRRRLIIVICITLVIILAIVGSIAIVDFGSSSDPVDAVISVENKITRLGDGVVMDAGNSSGKIEGYFWDFGDGNTSTNVSVIHQYEFVGWYDVSLSVVGLDGHSSNNSVVIGVQQNDNEANLDLSRMVWIGQGRMGNYVDSPLGPNIGNPTTEVQIHLEGAVGNIGITLRYVEEGRHREVYSETFTATGGTFDYSHTFQPYDIPLETQSSMCEIQFTIWVEEGKWRSGDLYMNVMFPIDNLVP